MPGIDLGDAWADNVWECGVWADGVWAGQETQEAAGCGAGGGGASALADLIRIGFVDPSVQVTGVDNPIRRYGDTS